MAESRGFLGAGDLFLRRYVNGVLGQWQGPYEASKFEIKPNVDVKELVSKGRNTYGQVIESATIPQPADLTIDMQEVNKESLAIALLGTVAPLTQSGGTLTAEVLPNDVVLDAWYPLSKHNLTGTPVLTDSAAAVTYVYGTDYIVDKSMGWVKALSTGAIPALSDGMKFTSAYLATAGNRISGMTDPSLRVQARLEGKNFADGLPVRVTVYEAVIAADSAFDFLQDDFGVISLPGRMKTPVGYTEPFIVDKMTSISTS